MRNPLDRYPRDVNFAKHVYEIDTKSLVDKYFFNQ